MAAPQKREREPLGVLSTDARDWHALPQIDVLRLLETAASGLSDAEAANRLEQYGANALIAPPTDPAWRILARQFRSVVVGLLVLATVLAWWTADVADAATIAAVLVLNVALGFVTELRARRAMDALLQLDVPSAVVLRDGSIRSVNARELVPGDVIVLEAGQAVAADARLLSATTLQTVEAPLTGESTSVMKDAEVTLPADTALPERATMVYKGTTVADGVARAVVVTTGMQTEVGHIGALVRTIRDEPTRLERKLDSLGRRLAAAAVGIGVLVGALELMRGAALAGVLQIAIAVAIAAVPEGLPAVVTTTMAIATRRMARRHALVRRLPAVETLGSVSVICTDKTGTLTAGRQMVTRIWIADVELEVPSSASPSGDSLMARIDSLATADAQRVRHVLSVGALANRAQIGDGDGTAQARGDPTEVALLAAARDAGIFRSALLRDRPEVGELPFSSARMLMATVHAQAGGGLLAYMKGAHDRVLPRCARIMTESGDQAMDAHWRRVIDDRATDLASRGLRVLALADGPVQDIAEESLRELRLVGLVGLSDPPASGVAETIATLRGAGIRTVMLTGDHIRTARAVARSVGLATDDAEALDGPALDRLSDEELADRADHIGIVSRVSPEGKLRVISALQRRGHIVAMLGDGINDAAALKKADIGVAMGGRGTDAAKEVAGIVLEDDRFATIAVAVEQGRVVFDNIRKFVLYLFSCNIAEIAVLLGAGLSGLPLPMTAMQILWLNLVTDTFPALALAMEPAAETVLRRPPRDPQAALLSRGMLVRALGYSLLIALVTTAALLWGLREWPELPARAVTLSFTTLALAQIFHLGNARSEGPVVSGSQVVANQYALAAVALTLVLQVAAVTLRPLGSMLGTVPLPVHAWLVAFALSAVPALLGQSWKVIARRRH